jgi:hypothetical protein
MTRYAKRKLKYSLNENFNSLPYVELCLCIGYSTIETKEADRIGYNGFLFPHEYSGEGRGA